MKKSLKKTPSRSRLKYAPKTRAKSQPKVAPTPPSLDGVVQLPAYATELWKPHRYKILWGGRGGARSWTVARSLLLKAAQGKLRVLCAREMQSSLRDSVHQLLRDQIDIMGLTGFRVTDREIRHLYNGSLFIFEGLRHNATKIKSLEGIDICWVEEAERITKESWSILIPTIRKAGSEIWVTFNPDAETDATYVRFIMRSPVDCWQKKVGWEDNPWLTDELLAEKNYMYETDPEAADHVWGGNIRQHSAAQILKDKWIIKEFTIALDEDGDPIDDSWKGPYLGMDFGFGSDPFAGIKAWINDRTLYLEQESYGHGVDIDDTTALVTEQIPGYERFVARADSARPDSISYLRRHGLPRIIGAKKGPGSVEDGIAHLRSYEQIIVHPRCKHTIDECKLWSYKVDALSGDVLPVIVDKHNHIMDALRYALEPMIKPRRMAGFIFSHAEVRKLCPECESFLPDDGECVHCDYNEAEAAAVAEVIAPVEAELIHTNGNGNGNGNGNENGHHPIQRPIVPRPPHRLRGLNG